MDSYPPSVNELADSLSDSGIPHALLVKEIRKAIDEGDWKNLQERVERLKKSSLQIVMKKQKNCILN